MGESICYKHSKWEERQLELTLCEVPANPATRDILRKSGFIALVTLEFCKIQLSSPELNKTQVLDSKDVMFYHSL